MGRPKGSTSTKKKTQQQKPLRRCLGHGCNKLVQGWFCWHCAYAKDHAYEMPIHKVVTGE